MKRVLVTGAAGFLGSYVVDALLERGCHVMAYDCLLPQVHPRAPTWPDYQPDHERLVKWFGDVRQYRNAFLPALEEFRPDTVIHLAAAVGVGQSTYEPAHYTSVNVTGTAAVVDWILRWNREQDGVEAGLVELARTDDVEAQDGQTQDEAVAAFLESIAPMQVALEEKRRPRIERLFVAGSMSSYGEGAYVSSGPVPVELPPGHPDAVPAPTPEEHPLRGASVYAWSKGEAERLALMLGRQHGLDVRVARFFNAYGSRQALSNPYTGVAAIFAARLQAGLAPVVYEDGGMTRDFTHASDIASAVLAILDHGNAGEVYNVGTGVPTSVLELACMLALRVAPEGATPIVPIVTGTSRVGDIRHCYADATKLRALGWEPKVALEDGVTELLAWVASQPAESQELLDRAHAELEALGLVG